MKSSITHKMQQADKDRAAWLMRLSFGIEPVQKQVKQPSTDAQRIVFEVMP